MACGVAGTRIAEEVEGARDGRACAWRSGPRAQASGEPWGDIPEVCERATRAGAWDDVSGAFEGVDEAVVVAARCGGAAVPAGGTIACPWYVYHVHQEPS